METYRVVRCVGCGRYMPSFDPWRNEKRDYCYACPDPTVLVEESGVWVDSIDYTVYLPHSRLAQRPYWSAARIQRAFPNPHARSINPRNPRHPTRLYLLSEIEREETVADARRKTRDDSTPRAVEWFVRSYLDFRVEFQRLHPEDRALAMDQIRSAIAELERRSVPLRDQAPKPASLLSPRPEDRATPSVPPPRTARLN